MSRVAGRIAEWADGTRRGAAFVDGLFHHLRRPLTLEQARTALAARRVRRDADLLAVARQAIFRNPRSPYRFLLRHAGCEYGDLERLVRTEGVEGTLQALFRQGVYLTAAQVKGHEPVVRGPERITVGLPKLRSPSWRVPGPLLGPEDRAGRRVSIYRALVQDVVINARLALDARGGTTWRHAVWGYPNDAWLLWLVRFWGPGVRPARWFSRLDPRASPVAIERWVTRVLPSMTRWAGVPLPPIEHAPLSAPQAIVSWLGTELGAGQRPHLVAAPSSAVHLCRMARAQGLELHGVEFTLTGEPITAARDAAIRSTGAGLTTSYGAKESGIMGYGCLRPAEVDELHCYDDSHVFVQPGPGGAVAGLPPDALLVTCLRPSWPYVALNLSLGDRGTLTRRACGCPMESLGWTEHLHTVRSFEKLKVGGVLFLERELTGLIDEVLPARFGGAPTDYQLVVDDEVVDGALRLKLLVHPAVGPLDEPTVRAQVLASFAEAGVPVAALWREPRWLTVERAAPLSTDRGKILHVHRVERGPEGHRR